MQKLRNNWKELNALEKIAAILAPIFVVAYFALLGLRLFDVLKISNLWNYLCIGGYVLCLVARALAKKKPAENREEA